ncbi:hypothetical protein AgCh_009631 [Apium graveolens]
MLRLNARNPEKLEKGGAAVAEVAGNRILKGRTLERIVREMYDEGKRTAETLSMDYHRGLNLEALNLGLLAKGGIVTEGSAGSTAISLATVAPACGCKFHAVIPDDAAIDKACMRTFVTDESLRFISTLI